MQIASVHRLFKEKSHNSHTERVEQVFATYLPCRGFRCEWFCHIYETDFFAVQLLVMNSDTKTVLFTLLLRARASV